MNHLAQSQWKTGDSSTCSHVEWEDERSLVGADGEECVGALCPLATVLT